MSKIVLFDGTSMDKWVCRDGSPAKWRIEDGAMYVTPDGGDIISTENFGDAHIHVEFVEPDGKGNSGVYIHGCIEIQIYNTQDHVDEHILNDCGSIYRIHAPRVNAEKPPHEWQTYDIFFRAARFDEDGNVVNNAFATIFQNDICIHNNVEIPCATPGGIGEKLVAEGPLLLQNHDKDEVGFRNIWIEKY